MKILIFNWRSIKDPLAGGAELATIELAKRWVKNHQAKVIWVSPPYDKNIVKELVDGVEFVYLGPILQRDKILKMFFLFPLFYLLCIIEYFRNYRGKIDILIDQSHGIPFLTPLYVKEKKILYIHEVADKIWDKMFPFPINKLGKILEVVFLKLYKNTIIVTVSEGAKNDLIKLGLESNNIKKVLNGIKINSINLPKNKYKNFTLLFLNRVVRMKGPDQAIEIFSDISKKIPNSKLIIAGKYDENYKKELDEIINKLNVKNIEFKGYISETEKIELLQKSHILINTSMKEGWGIVNIEANSQGTPVVAYNVEGCRESVQNGVSGYLAEDNNEFVEKIIKLSKENLEQSSIEYSKQFSYDEKAEEFWEIINAK